MQRKSRRSSRRPRRGYGLHFQVYAEFKLKHGKPQLVGASVSSTYAACTTIPFTPYAAKLLTISCIFPALETANSYIAHLYRVYKKNLALPVLDSEQKELFSEVSK